MDVSKKCKKGIEDDWIEKKEQRPLKRRFLFFFVPNPDLSGVFE